MAKSFKNKLDYLRWVRNLFLSTGIHFLLFLGALIIINLQGNKLKVNPNYFFLETKQFEKIYDNADDQSVLNQQEMKETPLNETSRENDQTKFISFSEIKADTTQLDQLYKESTLNVSVKYPKGWTFIDQRKRKKLDGVTFWAADGVNDPPPYIHLEVVEKYLFNEKKFRFKME